MDSSSVSTPCTFASGTITSTGDISTVGNLIMSSNTCKIITSVSDPLYNLTLETVSGGGSIYLNPTGIINTIFNLQTVLYRNQ